MWSDGLTRIGEASVQVAGQVVLAYGKGNGGDEEGEQQHAQYEDC